MLAAGNDIENNGIGLRIGVSEEIGFRYAFKCNTVAFPAFRVSRFAG